MRLGATSAERTRCYRELFQEHMDNALLTQIRQTLNQGMVLGNDRFKEEIAQLSGRRVEVLKRGPKSKLESSPEFLP